MNRGSAVMVQAMADDLFQVGIGEAFGDQPSGGRPSHNARGEENSASAKRLDILYQDYQRAIDAVDKKFDQILRIAGIGFSGAGALLFLVAGQDLELGEWAYWVAPLMLTLLYAIVINLLYHMSFSSYYARQLEDDIATGAGIPYFHHQNTVIRGLSSFRTGYPPMLVTYMLIVLFACAIYGALVILSFVQLRSLSVPGWRQATFITLHGLLAAGLLWGATGTAAALRTQYDKWKNVSAAATVASEARYERQSKTWRILSYALLPRRFDFLFKSLITIASLVVTVIIQRASVSRDLLWTGFWVVVCVEFLAKQATYIWNEVLDIEMDRFHPYKSRTRLLAILGNARLGKVLFFVRTAASFVVAFVLDAELDVPWLPGLVLFIFGWQFLYDRWAKRRPVSRLWVASLGYAQRVLAGALVVMSTEGRLDWMLLLLLVGWIVAFELVVLAQFWRADVENLWSTKGSLLAKFRGADIGAAAARSWFLSTSARTLGIRANGILFLIGLTAAYVYADDPSRGSRVVADEAAESQRTVTRAVAPILEPLGSAITNMWRVDILEGWGPVPRFGLIVAGLSLLGYRLMIALRRTVRRETRTRWLLGATAVAILSVCLAPPGWRLVVAAFFLPLIVAIAYEQLSYDEIIAFDKVLNDAFKNLVPAVDWMLFRPWAVRICITPVVSSLAPDPEGWLRDLRAMYAAWGTRKLIDTHFTEDDGGGPYDLVMEARHPDVWRLGSETGLHRRSVVVADGQGQGRTVVHLARVEVRPISIRVDPAMGNGLELLDASKIGQMIDDSRLDLVRHYGCRASTYQNGTPIACYDVYDLRTGVHSTEPDHVLDGEIDAFLCSPAGQDRVGGPS